MRRTARILSALLAAVMPVLAFGQPSTREWWFQEPVTEVARQQVDLHNHILTVCIIIFIGVFGVMCYSLYRHRKSVGHQATHFHENTIVEVVWTVIPFLVLLVMAYPATRTILFYRDAGSPDMTVKVTGYQWKWSYDYLDEGFGFYSELATPLAQRENREAKGPNYLLEVDNPLVVPVDTKVRVLVTANDVLHAWWVPAFGIKQDAIPGFVRDTWFRAEKVGIYRGQCAELCGKEHAFMPIVVDVRSKADYASWLAEQKKKASASASAEAGEGTPVATAPADDPNKVWDLAALKERGEKVYLANCAACHQPNGKGLAPAFPPLDGSAVVMGPKEAQIQLLLAGKKGTAMASFAHLSDTDLAAVATYTRNAWSNATGQPVQPAEFASARGK